MTPFEIFAALAVILVLAVLAGSIKLVRQGETCTIERLGRYTRTLHPGFHILTPFIERIGARMSMKEQVLDIPTQEVITRDNAMVGVDGVVFYQVHDAAKATYEVADLQLAVLNLTMTNIRTVIGSMDLDDILSQRDKINAALLGVVDDATTPWGIKVTRIEIKDINPPRDIVESMGRQMKAEREKRAAILEAEGKRGSEILRAEGEKQAKVLEAEGRREAAILDAEARERLAAAEAEATRLVSNAIATGDARAVNYFIAQKYVEALAEFARSPNGRIVFMPIETSGVIGALGSMQELFRSTDDDDSGGSGGSGGAPAGPWRRSGRRTEG